MLPRLCITAVVVSVVFGIPLEFEDTIGKFFVNTGEEVETVPKHDDGKKGEIWAVLVAGSYGFYNYRHQADVCHSYQILRTHGVPNSNIIVMMYDDIANNSKNPTPGVIINKPDGRNVYENMLKDYTGADVTPQNFLNVITGNAAAMKGIGSGKVLKSGPNDNVVINLVDRGGPGLFGFPNDHLYAKDFIQNLKKMFRKKMYNKALIYMEASYAGSMFDHHLPKDINILAITAAGSHNESYATYFDETLNTYLGDLFSVAWMEDIDSEEHHKNLTTETIDTQYKNVVERAKNWSVPMMYGDKKIRKQHVTHFFGKDQKKTTEFVGDETPLGQFEGAVKSQDAILYIIRRKIQKEENHEERQKLQNELDALLQGRYEIEQLFDRIISRLPSVDLKKLKNERQPLTEEVSTCYIDLVDAFNKECVNINKNTFTFRHLYKLVNLCATDNISTKDVLEAFGMECRYPHHFDGVH